LLPALIKAQGAGQLLDDVRRWLLKGFRQRGFQRFGAAGIQTPCPLGFKYLLQALSGVGCNAIERGVLTFRWRASLAAFEPVADKTRLASTKLLNTYANSLPVLCVVGGAQLTVMPV